MSRVPVFIYGLVSYSIGMVGLLWFVLFVGGWEFLPRHIDSDMLGSIGSAIMINIGLVILFGLQHTIMARPAFKEWWTKRTPHAVERSTYSLLSGVILILFCLFWKPIDGYVWQAENEVLRIILFSGYVFGWLVSGFSTFLINHFELFGLQRVYYHLIQKDEPAPYFIERSFYKIVRHPIQLGIIIGLWFTPEMSLSHLMLALVMTIYIIIGLHYEEKDLVATLGKDYEDYQRRVRKFVPLLK